MIELSLCRGDEGALANLRIAARLMLDFTRGDFLEIGLEPGECRFLNEFMCVFIDRGDAGSSEIRLRAAADFGDEHGVAIIDGANDGGERVLLAIAALAIHIHAAMADEFCTRSGEFVDLELLGMTEMLVDKAGALGGDGDKE